MKERPIIFSTPMVQAILSGRKTMTRRVVKLPDCDYPKEWLTNGVSENGIFLFGNDTGHRDVDKKCPYGRPGDRLWVRETFGWYNTIVQGSYGYVEGEEVRYPPHVIKNGFKRPIVYKADFPKHRFDPNDSGWKPSIHMPQSASRITLEITNVRVERLQDISFNDATKEGVEILHHEGRLYKDYELKDGIYATAKGSFASLWRSINGEGSWNLNPWVWVIQFAVL